MSKLLIGIAFALLLIGCKSESGSVAFVQDPACNPPVDNNNVVYDTKEYFGDGTEIGYYIQEDATYIWYRASCANNFFALKKSDQSLKESVGLVYQDAACAVATHEEFNYPLHFSNDTYVFQFEGDLYQYPVGAGLDTLNSFYYRVPGGACTLVNNPSNSLREIAPFTENLF